MKMKLDEVEINGDVYVKKDSISKLAVDTDGLQYVVIRSDRAGVFAGYLEDDRDDIVILKDARRLWRWYGAQDCTELARRGTTDPDRCQFTAPIEKIKILTVIENISATETAKKSIEGVKVWEA